MAQWFEGRSINRKVSDSDSPERKNSNTLRNDFWGEKPLRGREQTMHYDEKQNKNHFTEERQGRT